MSHFHYGTPVLPETYTLKEETVQSVDYGIDYYAMQTLLAPDGRRIMIAWMQNWDTIAHRCSDSKWFAQMSLPRELSNVITSLSITISLYSTLSLRIASSSLIGV